MSYIKRSYEIFFEEGPKELFQKTEEHIKRQYSPYILRIQNRIHSFRCVNYAEYNPYVEIELDAFNINEVSAESEETKPLFDPKEYNGSIMGGKWDKKRIKINQTNQYECVKNIIKNEDSIENKPFDYFIKKYNEKLVDDSSDSGNNFQQNITVNIDRYGRVLLNSGLTKLLFLKLTGKEKIRGKIVLRHKKWQYFRNLLKYMNREKTSYNLLPHPDLQDFEPKTGRDSSLRFQMMKDSMDNHTGNLLDIGAYDGYNSFKFEEIGYNCTAVEIIPTRAFIISKLKKAKKSNIEILNKSIYGHRILEEDYDVILALSVFHHWLKDESDVEKLEKIFNRMNTEVLFLHSHSYEQYKNDDRYVVDYVEDSFAEFVIENSDLNKFDMLGRTEDDRPLYKIY